MSRRKRAWPVQSFAPPGCDLGLRCGPFARQDGDTMRQLLGAVQLVVAIALMALVGQAILYVLAGASREKNVFYQIIRIVPSPFVKLTRMLTPRVFDDRVIPFAAFCWLAAIFLWLAFAIPGVAP
jgi:hypothetical protein